MGTDRSNQLKKQKKSYFLPTILLVFLLITGYYLNKNILVVKKIHCQENEQTCSQATLDKIAHFYNKSIFFTNFDQDLEQFSDYYLEKRLPNELSVNLSNVQSQYYGVDENNKFVITKDDQLDKETNLIANNIHNQLQKQEIIFQSIELKNGVLIIELQEGMRALIDSNQITLGVTKLKIIQSNLSLKEIDTGIIEIDARYKMPVLKTKLSDI